MANHQVTVYVLNFYNEEKVTEDDVEFSKINLLNKLL